LLKHYVIVHRKPCGRVRATTPARRPWRRKCRTCSAGNSSAHA